MEIKIQFKKKVFSLCFGYKTLWFEQMHFFTITEEFYDKCKTVYYATFINHWF